MNLKFIENYNKKNVFKRSDVYQVLHSSQVMSRRSNPFMVISVICMLFLFVYVIYLPRLGQTVAPLYVGQCQEQRLVYFTVIVFKAVVY